MFYRFLPDDVPRDHGKCYYMLQGTSVYRMSVRLPTKTKTGRDTSRLFYMLLTAPNFAKAMRVLNRFITARATEHAAVWSELDCGFVSMRKMNDVEVLWPVMRRGRKRLTQRPSLFPISRLSKMLAARRSTSGPAHEIFQAEFDAEDDDGRVRKQKVYICARGFEQSTRLINQYTYHEYGEVVALDKHVRTQMADMLGLNTINPGGDADPRCDSCHDSASDTTDADSEPGSDDEDESKGDEDAADEPAVAVASAPSSEDS